jgi:hypothetical protein
MAFNVKNGIKIIEGKAYVHPFTESDLENLMALLSNIEVKGSDAQILIDLKHKIAQEYQSLKEHMSK